MFASQFLVDDFAVNVVTAAHHVSYGKASLRAAVTGTWVKSTTDIRGLQSPRNNEPECGIVEFNIFFDIDLNLGIATQQASL